MASPKIGRQLEKVKRDWHGIKAVIGDRVSYVRSTPPTGRWHKTLPGGLSPPSAATGDISVSGILLAVIGVRGNIRWSPWRA